MIQILRSFKRRYLLSISAQIERRILHRWFSSMSVNGALIDLGGGASPYLPSLPDSLDTVSVDIDGDNRTSVIADAHRIPFCDSSFDAAICTNILEHLRDPELCIEELARILKSGAELVVVVPFMFRVHPNPEDHWRFTGQCLERLFADNFSVVEQYSPGGRFLIIWEIIGQLRLFEIIRIINPLIARIPLYSREYPLNYCLRLRRR